MIGAHYPHAAYAAQYERGDDEPERYVGNDLFGDLQRALQRAEEGTMGTKWKRYVIEYTCQARGEAIVRARSEKEAREAFENGDTERDYLPETSDVEITSVTDGEE